MRPAGDLLREEIAQKRGCFTFSILGKLPVVPVGDAGTIPYSMRQHAADFVGAAFDTREGAGDGVVGTSKTWALSWSRERGEK